jgi:hypothetical protein
MFLCVGSSCISSQATSQLWAQVSNACRRRFPVPVRLMSIQYDPRGIYVILHGSSSLTDILLKMEYIS